MSRRAAREKLSLEEYQETMKGIYTTSVNASTIDEAPMAYKPAKFITENLEESVSIEGVMKPIFNFKAGEESGRRRGRRRDFRERRRDGDEMANVPKAAMLIDEALNADGERQ